MSTRQPVAGTLSRLATPSACVDPWCISHDSPSSVGVESVSSGSWPWKRMWRLWCRNFSAFSDTPGKTGSAASALAFAAFLVHFFDQSERTITTDPSGIRRFWRSNFWISETCRAYFGSFLTCGTIEITTSGRTAKVGGSSSIAGYSGAQCAGGSSCVPNWSVWRRDAVAAKPSFAYEYGRPVAGSTVGLNLPGPKPFQTGMFGVIG